ncbi:L,D-transpeptidase [Aliinostoc sp. HNIBRCY26]|uniref:L,D-transpeptidase n=1 Tax=Aliinostoc sp. HNIBRCY26 TaxID=3418997 RepID=UPI003D03632A
MPDNPSSVKEGKRSSKDIFTNNNDPSSNVEYSSPESLNNNPIQLNSHNIEQNNYLAQRVSVGTKNGAGNYMTLTPSGRTNDLGNPLFELRLYVNNQPVGSFLAVSGRTHTQNKNRHRSGTEAPLPNGIYTVAKNYTRGTIAEAGERFLPITPRFRTGRTDLGIHVDPSYNKNNGEDGTSGCIGLTNTRDLDQLLNYVRNYQPQYINVQI